MNLKPNEKECTSFDPIIVRCPDKIISCCYYVEQPVIVQHTVKRVNHYIPKMVYYHTFSEKEENVCYKKNK